MDHSMDHHLVNLCASAQWLFSLVGDTLDGDLSRVLYSGEATAVPPTVIEQLTNPALHCGVCSLLSTTRRSGSATGGTFSSVLQWLGRQGIYPVAPRGSPLSSALLEKQHPFHLESHQALLDALMEAYITKRVTIEGVVRAVRRIGEFSASRDLPGNLEEALVLWINRVCEYCGGMAGMVAVSNLLLSLQDGKCFALLLSHYLPQAGNELKAISTSPPLPESMMQIKSVCSSWLPHPALHFHPPALTTHPYGPIWRLHLLVTLAHLFWCFEGEGHPLVGHQAPPHSQPRTLQTPVYAKPPSGAEGRRDVLGGGVRSKGYSTDRLSSTSDTSLVATAHNDPAAALKRAVFHPPLRQNGSLTQLPLHGDPTSRITASVTGLVKDAGQQRVGSRLRVRRTSSTSSLGTEQRGGLGEDVGDSGSTASSTTGGSMVSVVSETALGHHPHEPLRLNSGYPPDANARRQAWGSPLSCTTEPVLSSGQAAQHSSQGVTIPTVQGRVPSSVAGSQSCTRFLTRLDSAESTETVTMTTEQATTSTVNATVTAMEVAMAADDVATAASVPSPQGFPPPSPPPADNLTGLQPIKVVDVVFLDEPKKKDWDSILPKDPESLLLRMKVQDLMHQYKGRKEAQRQQATREWHAERMRLVAHMCATGVMEPSLFFPPQQGHAAVTWTKENGALVLNGVGEEVEHPAIVSSSGQEQYEQHQPWVQSDGYAVETKDTRHTTAMPTHQPQVVMPTPFAAPPPPTAMPPAASSLTAATPPPTATPPAASPPHAATPPPTAATHPPPPHQRPPVDAALLATKEQMPEWKKKQDMMKARLDERERARREAAERKRAQREAKKQQWQSSLPLEESQDTSPGPAPVPQQPATVQQPQPQPRPTQPRHPPRTNTMHSAVAVERHLTQPVRPPVVSYPTPLQPAAEGMGPAVPAHLQTIRFILSDTNGAEDVRPKQPTAFYAHTGPKCYNPPKTKSNKQLMRVALSTVCLAGDANLDRRIEALQALDGADATHILIHFKDGAGSRKFKGLYAFAPDSNEARKVHGAGPRVVTPEKVAAFFKYNSGTREFFTVPAKHFSFSIDGFTVAPQYWSSRKSRK